MISLKCASCGVDMILNDDIYHRRKEDGNTFYCVNGHPNVFRPSEAERLRKQVAELTETARYLQASKADLYRSLTAYKANLGKMRKRIKMLEETIKEAHYE